MTKREMKYHRYQKHYTPKRMWAYLNKIMQQPRPEQKYYTYDSATGKTFMSDRPVSATVTVTIHRQALNK